MLNKVNYKILSVVGESIVDVQEKIDMLARVRKNGHALQHASAELQGDREIVQAAVSQNVRALRFASDALKNSGLKSYVERLINQYNVTKDTFIATILFGARQTSQGDDQEGIDLDSLHSRLGGQSKSALRLLGPSSKEGDDFSTHAKRLICEYAGVVSRERWRVIEAAARNLGIEIPGERGRDIESVARCLKVDVPVSKPHNVCCTVS